MFLKIIRIIVKKCTILPLSLLLNQCRMEKNRKLNWSGSGEEGEGAGGAACSPAGEAPPQHSRPGQGTSLSPLPTGRKFGRLTQKGRIKNLQPDKSAVKGCRAVFGRNARTRVFVFEVIALKFASLPTPSFLSFIGKMKKIIISTVLWLLNNFLFMKTDLNIPKVRNKQNKLTFCE
jgi:hypothetical protein